VPELFGDRVAWRTQRDVLEITAFAHPRDYGEHFKARYAPTIVARANDGAGDPPAGPVVAAALPAMR
jgi:hypothetical protein